MNFGELLKQCIGEEADSVRHFSEITGINRGWIYNIFNGKKSLPEDKFQLILERFPFSRKNADMLRETYYRDFVYGKETYERIQYIFDQINNDCLSAVPTDICHHKRLDFHESSTYLSSGKELQEALLYLTNSWTTDGEHWCYTNFSYDQIDIDSALYNSLYDNPINLFHMIEMSTVESGIKNLENIFFSAKYATLGLNTYYYQTDHTELHRSLVSYPYFFITDSGVLLYDYHLLQGILMTEPQTISCFKKMALCLFSQTTPLVHFFNDIFEYKNYMAQHDTIQESFAFEASPCINAFLDSELISSILVDKSLIHYICNTVDDWQTYWADFSKITFFHSQEGIRQFAQTGNYYPSTLAHPLSKEERIKILQNFIDSNKQFQNFFLADERHIKCYPNIVFDIYPNITFISGNLKQNQDCTYVGDWMIMISDPLMVADFIHFKEFIMRNRFHHSFDFTNHFLYDLILKLETEIEIEKNNKKR